MTEQLLSKLDVVPALRGTFENLHDLARRLACEVDTAAQSLQGSSDNFSVVWRRMVMDVAKGARAEVHRFRNRFATALEDRIKLIKEVRELCPPPQGATLQLLNEELARLEHFKETVTDRWQTTEDLEDLAARDYPLSAADLERLGPSRPADASWFKEEGKPF